MCRKITTLTCRKSAKNPHLNLARNLQFNNYKLRNRVSDQDMFSDSEKGGNWGIQFCSCSK